MNTKFKTLALASAAVISTALISASANAQVAGIAIANPTVVVAKSKALGAAYTLIGTTFSSNQGLMVSRGKEINELRKSLDTNKDNQLDQAEMDTAVKAKNPALASIDAKEAEIGQLQEPIIKAQLYAIEQILSKYNAAQQQVITAKKLSVILAPDGLVWWSPTIDVTDAITASLDVMAPTVAITPPAGWQPTSREAYGVQQQIEQLLRASAQQKQQQAAQSAPGATPAAPGTKPATPAPRPQPETR
jgi:Skp family chaperone for outer membrane proteins